MTNESSFFLEYLNLKIKFVLRLISHIQDPKQIQYNIKRLNKFIESNGKLIFSDNVDKNSLQVFEISSELINIGNSAFKNCTGFTGDLTLPDSVVDEKRK